MTAKKIIRQQIVMLTADVGSYSITNVNLAVQMAISMNTGLRGLFIEDEDLLQVTGLPLAREICLTTARERPTSVDQMQRSMRAVAHQFEQALKRAAGAAKVTWSFNCVRGRARDLGMAQATDATYTILSQSVSQRLSSRLERVARKILLVTNRSPYQMRALGAVLERFGQERVALTLVDEKLEAKLPSEITQLLAEKNETLKLCRLSREQLFEQLSRLGSGFDCAILSRHEKPRDLALITKNLSCPIILVA